MTDEAIRELCIAVTRNEAGRHFTEWMNHWEELESAGYLGIHRPIHEATGIPYSQECWTLVVTDWGQQLVDNDPELHPQQGE